MKQLAWRRLTDSTRARVRVVVVAAVCDVTLAAVKCVTNHLRPALAFAAALTRRMPPLPPTGRRQKSLGARARDKCAAAAAAACFEYARRCRHHSDAH